MVGNVEMHEQVSGKHLRPTRDVNASVMASHYCVTQAHKTEIA